MENQQRRLPWLRLATLRIAEAEAQSQTEPIQPAQPPQPAATRQPTLPVVRVPAVPPAVPQSSSPAQPATQPAPQPMTMAPVLLPTVQPAQPRPRPPTPPQQDMPKPAPQPLTMAPVLLPTVQPAQPRPRPPTPPQQDMPKPAVPTSNGAAMPATTPSPPPSPKVIKTSTPTPPPSPRIKTVAQVPPISVPTNQTANPEAETKPGPVLSSQVKSAMLDDRDYKVKGNGDSYDNANATEGTNGGDGSDGKMNGAAHNDGKGKIITEINGKNTFNESNHSNMNHSPHLERKEIENGRVTFEARDKHHHLHSGQAMQNSNHKKSDKDMKVITIAGENIGALMKLGHNAHGYSTKMHQGGHSLTGESPAHDGKATEIRDNKGVTHAKPMTSLVNSNVQSINNSLLFNSSCTQRSPGVYLTFKSKGKGKAHKHGQNSPSS